MLALDRAVPDLYRGIGEVQRDQELVRGVEREKIGADHATAYYTPLEQYGGESEHTDVRSDIYAVGATFYHLLSGKPPPEARARFLNPNVLRPLNEINKPVSKNLAELIKWALEMHPDDRPKTIAALEDAIFKDGRRPKSGKRQVNGSTLSYALRENAAMAFVVIFLLLLALVLTIR
jgi:serine/threonine-protein kinase